MKEKYRVIYTPRGAAKEYSDLAVNLEIGCEHGCTYCYGPGCMKMSRQSFLRHTQRKEILKKLEMDLNEMQQIGDNRRTLLCFITDPYQPSENGLTREALKLFREYDRPFQVLTKGGMRAARDFDLYSKKDAYAATIVFDNDETRKVIEPNAATIEERIESLKIAKEKGIETWLSLEPVIYPGQALNVIKKTMGLVDKYKIGKINNFKMTHKPDWQQFTDEVIELLNSTGQNYYIKESLRQYVR